nr:MAG TPA: hypothetical protein [Caudoviricetes sp.]
MLPLLPFWFIRYQKQITLTNLANTTFATLFLVSLPSYHNISHVRGLLIFGIHTYICPYIGMDFSR